MVEFCHSPQAGEVRKSNYDRATCAFMFGLDI